MSDIINEERYPEEWDIPENHMFVDVDFTWEPPKCIRSTDPSVPNPMNYETLKSKEFLDKIYLERTTAIIMAGVTREFNLDRLGFIQLETDTEVLKWVERNIEDLKYRTPWQQIKAAKAYIESKRKELNHDYV